MAGAPVSERRLRARVWLLDHLSPGVVARPFEWFFAALCLTSAATTSLRLAAGEASPPLPHAAAWFWVACLVVGALGMMCGLTSIRVTATGMHVVTRVPCYRFGLRLLLAASVVYAVADVTVGKWGPAVALALVAAACYVRLLTLAGREAAR